MLSLHISELQNNPNFSIDASNTVYTIFMLIGIVGYFTVPTVANWIISAGGIGAYNRNISGNINQNLLVDSVACNFDTYPYKIVTYARQLIIRESNVTERSLVTRCNLINSVRSDNNPHGFTMENFEIVENRDLRVIDR
jgi:hypothetical protein